MASGSMRHHIDIEAQDVASQPPEVGTSMMHRMGVHQPQANSGSDAGQEIPASAHQSVASVNPQLLKQLEEFFRPGFGGIPTIGAYVNRSEPERRTSDATVQETTRGEQSQTQAETQTPVARDTSVDLRETHVNYDDPPVDGGPIGGSSGREPEEKRMIGDFDGSANPLWTLYGNEAKSHDESRIQTLKGDMDGVLIFAGLFSAALTAFIIDSKQNLKANTADQTVYYLQQNVAILSQISQQIASIVPQVAVPSTPPPPFPAFNPSTSDVRVNAFWFMALIFSLSSALLATLVQQWVRDYMHVFQRYSDPLKSARIRQYLYEGSEGWYMPVIAEAVPGLLHVALFLFFVGLGDFVLNTNTAVGLSTIIPIGICGLFYILTTFAPVIYPQSPYQNSFSGLIWYLVQTLHGRSYKDRDGNSKSVSANMTQGQMQLAMEETEERKGRDTRSIKWLLDSLTEDSELESFTMAIPGSFNGEWSAEVWTRMSKLAGDKDGKPHRKGHGNGPPSDTNLNAALPLVAQPSSRFRIVPKPFGSIVRLLRTRTASHPHTNPIALPPTLHSPATHFPVVTTHERGVVRELSRRISHLFETCKNRGSFASDELWRRRTRACVEGAASLVFFADADLEWFGDIGRLLLDIGKVEKTRESSLMGMDQSFVTRWTCLSITATRSMLKHNLSVQQATRDSISELEDMPPETVGADGGLRTLARTFDDFLSGGWDCLFIICAALFARRYPNISEERVRQVLQILQPQMNGLRHTYLHATSMKMFDAWISVPQNSIQAATQGLICELPGVEFDGNRPDPLPFSLAVEMLNDFTLQFMLPGRCAVGFSSIFPRLQNILEGRDSEPGNFQELLNDLRSFQLEKAGLMSGNLVQLQLWRFQDLCFAGGLGFMIEIFFIALKELLSTSPSKDSQSTLYISTFRAITSDWREHRDSLGTQNILLHLISSCRGLMSRFNYPAYITDELLVFVDNMFKGQTGPHIDKAMDGLRRERNPVSYDGPPGFPTRALNVLLTSSRSSAP